MERSLAGEPQADGGRRRKTMQGNKTVESGKNQGYTMIIVMCLMFLFMALALSMLFSSTLLLAGAQRAAAQKQCRASAVSFAEWMDKNLGKEPLYDSGDPGNLSANIKKKFDDGSWRAYTGDFEHEAEVAILTFKPDPGSGTTRFPKELGDLEIKMYWETENGSTDPEDLYVDLVVTVRAEVQGEQFSVTTRYGKWLEPAAGSGELEWKGIWYVKGRE